MENVVTNKYENIEYKKNNPFIFKSLSSKIKFHNWYNSIKFSIVIVAFIFSLLALWYTSQWKNESLTRLGVNLNSFNFAGVEGFAWDEKWNAPIANANALSLANWSNASSINSTTINVLVALSFIAVVSIIPSLIFKNGTILSIISLSITFISTIVVIVLFVIVLNVQMGVISLYQNNDINQLKGNYDSNINRISTIDELLAKNDISDEVKTKLTDEKNKLINSNPQLVEKLNQEVKRVLDGVLKIVLGKGI